MTLESYLKEVKDRMDKATSDFRLSHEKLPHHNDYLIGVDCCEEEPFVMAEFNRYMSNWTNDSNFIAHSRTDVEKLLKIVEIYQEALSYMSRGDDFCSFIRAKDAIHQAQEAVK